MLVTITERQEAWNIPLLLPVGTALLVTGTWALAEEGSYWAAAFSALLAVAVGILSIGSFRRIRRRGPALLVRTPFRASEAAAAKTALGISVRYGHRGGPTYTVYALCGDATIDLYECGSKKRAAAGRDTLMSLLLSDTMGSDAARAARRQVETRESVWRDQETRSQQIIAEYYASRKVPWFLVVLISTITLAALALALYVQHSR